MEAHSIDHQLSTMNLICMCPCPPPPKCVSSLWENFPTRSLFQPKTIVLSFIWMTVGTKRKTMFGEQLHPSLGSMVKLERFFFFFCWGLKLISSSQLPLQLFFKNIFSSWKQKIDFLLVCSLLFLSFFLCDVSCCLEYVFLFSGLKFNSVSHWWFSIPYYW